METMWHCPECGSIMVEVVETYPDTATIYCGMCGATTRVSKREWRKAQRRVTGE